MQTKKPQKETTQTVQHNKKVITVTGKRGRSISKDKTTIREKLKKLLLESVFEIPDATSCKPIQAYISAGYSTSRAQGLITLLCSTTSGYKIITNVAFVAKRQNENSDYEIEKTWIKNAIRLYINELEVKEDFKIVFADELK